MVDIHDRSQKLFDWKPLLVYNIIKQTIFTLLIQSIFESRSLMDVAMSYTKMQIQKNELSIFYFT